MTHGNIACLILTLSPRLRGHFFQTQNRIFPFKTLFFISFAHLEQKKSASKPSTIREEGLEGVGELEVL